MQECDAPGLMAMDSPKGAIVPFKGDSETNTVVKASHSGAKVDADAGKSVAELTAAKPEATAAATIDNSNINGSEYLTANKSETAEKEVQKFDEKAEAVKEAERAQEESVSILAILPGYVADGDEDGDDIAAGADTTRGAADGQYVAEGNETSLFAGDDNTLVGLDLPEHNRLDSAARPAASTSRWEDYLTCDDGTPFYF